ncbi:MAG TPA: GGDEF domain-containing protein [Noviherbaspirillum sp.]|nr:GGDEF domain-containing protein [Noviherbaspirillum sp.]
MDALTAGSALIAVQLCVAVIMAGTFYTIPEEKCTRYWAQSGALVGLGVLIVVLNASTRNYPLLAIGNNTLIAGLVCQWWGLQAFHNREPSRWGWGILAGYFLVYGLQLAMKADVAERSALSAATSALIFILNFHELWLRRTLRLSFASALATAALVLLIGGFTFRAVANVLHDPAYLAATTSATGVAVVYFVPLVGTLLFSVALLLLYFERLVQTKHHLATHDELTGLLNRRAIISLGEREIDRAARAREPLAVAYIDVDYFKQINDELGHENGDAVLVELAEVLTDACRNTDLIGRYGGEEFCIVFPGIGAEGVDILGARLVNAVRAHRFCGRLAVTVSIGFAVLPADGERCPWTALVNAADSALYLAKEGGRDGFRTAGAAAVDGAETCIGVA